jgi:ABC-type transport system involved in cytochrome c biogenesis permease subunit
MEYYALEKGLGRHSQFIPLDSLVSALKYMQLGVLMAALAIWSIKISVCFFLLALLRDTNKRFRQFLWALMFFTTVTTFIGLLLWGLQARPLERLWDPRVKGTRGSSHDYLKVVYVFYGMFLSF